MRRDAIRLSYSQILRLRRCPWAWHVRHVRKLVPLRRKRPPPAWGDAYHAAAAAVWRQRASLEQSGHWLDGRALTETGYLDALAKLRELDVPGLDCEAFAAECAAAAVEVCQFVGPEWRVLWLDGEPVVERRLVTLIGEVDDRYQNKRGCVPCDGDGWSNEGGLTVPCVACGGSGDVLAAAVELVTVLDLALVHEDGRVRVVDHKSTTSWPESVGDVLCAEEEMDLDLRDDLQIRLYVLALRHALRYESAAGWIAEGGEYVPVEGAHLVRRASIGREPPRTYNGRGPLSRAAEYEATEEQWETAIRRHHLRREDYEQQIAQARLRRWQAWAPVEFTPQSLDLARREALQAAEEIARLEGVERDDVPRHRMPGRWQPYRPQRWSGSAPRTDAECFAWNSCAACDHRDLCVAEGQGADDAAALIVAGEYLHVDEAKEVRVALPEIEAAPCELDADEVD